MAASVLGRTVFQGDDRDCRGRQRFAATCKAALDHLASAKADANRVSASMGAVRPYTLSPMPLLGAVVRGLDLKEQVSQELVQLIKQDVMQYRLLVFKDQGKVSGARQVAISRWFGDLDSETFYKHPESPCRDVFRVSNDPRQGCTGVGRTGWHIDGTFRETPYSHAIYYMDAVPKQGATSFLPLKELYEAQPAAVQQRWERLWMCTRADRKGYVHPLVYSHPDTGLPTLCFHLGMTDAFIWDHDQPSKAQRTDAAETLHILDEIENAIQQAAPKLVYHHQWEEGDFIISDNLAVAHQATPETQLPVAQVGLRVLHRTTVKGTVLPQKLLHAGHAGAAQ